MTQIRRIIAPAAVLAVLLPAALFSAISISVTGNWSFSIGVGDLSGGAGSDLLIGGLGHDHLIGQGGDDLLIGGVTIFDADMNALLAILSEWASEKDYATRVSNLRGTTTEGNNGSYFLRTVGPNATVFDDDATDELIGSGGQDWFFAILGGLNGDVLTDRKQNELIDELFLRWPPS